MEVPGAVQKILVVEDDPAVASFLKDVLSEAHYAPEVCELGRDAISRLKSGKYKAALIDVMLPDVDGFEVVRQARLDRVTLPILMLSARFRVEDRIAGLDAGADDYLPKPFAVGELLAPVRALLRRGSASEELLSVGDLTLDPVARRVKRGERRIDLSATEYGLLEYFMRNAGRILDKGQILDHVWGDRDAFSYNNVEVYVNYVRRKTEAFGRSRMLHTVRGLGYVLEERQSG